MIKKLLFSVVVTLALALSGCTSDSKSDDEALDSGQSTSDSADQALDDSTLSADSAGGGEQSAAPAEGAENLDTAQLDDKGGGDLDFEKELGQDAAAAPQDAKAGDAAGALPEEPLGAANTDAAPPPVADQKTDSPPPEAAPVPETGDVPPVAAETTPAAPAPEGTPVAKASLKKVKDAPFNAKDGTLLNAVFIARKGHTMASVSQIIYGSNRAKDLKKWNPSLSKKLKVGDKVYYNSPQRPTDSTKMALYFEDIGAPPQVHTSAEGENLKPLGKQLLGDKNSWKELWETNPNLDSKGALTAGIEIRYWPQEPGATGSPEAAPTNPEQPQAAPPAPTLAQNAPPPPEPPKPAGPTQPEGGAAGTLEPPALPPPPPPEPPKPPRPAKVEAPQGTDPDLLMTLGVGAIIVVALVLLVVIRKNRSKRMDFGQTQV